MTKFDNDTVILEAFKRDQIAACEALGPDSCTDWLMSVLARVEVARQEERRHGLNSLDCTIAYSLLGRYITEQALRYGEQVFLAKEDHLFDREFDDDGVEL